MCRPKKKKLLGNWEGLYIFIAYKDGKGSQEQNRGSRICILKDLMEQCWECVKKDLQLCLFAN
jgi:hypothetical protein